MRISDWSSDVCSSDLGVAAMHQIHLAGDIGQVQGFFDRGIAAADYRHVLITEEKPVAGSTGRHALALEGFLRGQAKIFGGGASGDNQGVAGDRKSTRLNSSH